MNSNRQSPQAYRFGGFELDPRAGELRKQGRKIKLQGQPLDILTMLLEHPGEVVTREELQKRLWPADTFVDFEHSLNAAVKRLREALDDSADTPQFIETLPRRGYRFIGTLDGGSAVAPEGEQRRLARRWIGYAAIVLVVLFGVAFALNLGGWRDSVLHRSRMPRIQSIAVLPLENLSRDPEQEYFADGMTDALIANLAQISALRVISRTSVMRYKGTKKSLPEIARELNVDAVVEGTVLRSGERVRIIAQLIEAPTDRHLWAASYERDLRDVLALQSEVARAIAGEIRVQLTPREQVRLASVHVISPEAHEAYLRARYEFYQARNVIPGRQRNESLWRSVGLFQQAIQLEPTYAPTYAGLASSYDSLADERHREVAAKSREAAEKAVALDETLAEGHSALGSVALFNEWDWARAERELKRAIELNPNFAGAHSSYALYLRVVGRFDHAVSEINRARELDPSNLGLQTNAAHIYRCARQYDRAIETFQGLLKLDPNRWYDRYWLGVAYIDKGQLDQGLAEIKMAERHPEADPWARAALAWAEGLAGNRAAALRGRAKLESLSREQPVSPIARAIVHAALGEKDQVFRSLEEAWQQHDTQLVFQKSQVRLENLRGDPRYQDLLRRMGLPP